MNTYPPGVRIAGRYEVAGRPLMGGMGIVYVCFDHQEQRPVALKTFRPEYLPDRAARDRFLREGTHWVELGRHPHIVRCYRVIHFGLEVYLVLELVAREDGKENASLRAWIKPGQPLPIKIALLFALQIARGMRYAEETIPGFVHRDLKPENVLVGADRLANTSINRLRVTDFGLAQVLQNVEQEALSIDRQLSTNGSMPELSSRLTTDPLSHTQLTHGVVGTPFYMAPELWRGEGATVATDVYAFGCTLYEMLTGHRVVTGRTRDALRRAHCAGEIRPLPDGLPGPAKSLLMRSLAADADSRYSVWRNLEDALVQVYEVVSGQAVPSEGTAQSVSREDRVSSGWSYTAIGRGYLQIGKVKKAASYFQCAVDTGCVEREQRLECAALGNLGNANAMLGNAQCAINYFEKCLLIYRAIGDRQGEGKALNNLGSAYGQLGNARCAISYCEQSLKIAQEVGDRRGEGQAMSNLGSAYAALGDARCAAGYHEQARDIAQEIGDRRGEASALNNLGLAYAALGEPQRAISCYNQSLTIARETGDWRTEGEALGNLGSAYVDLGDARRAIEYYDQQLAIVRDIGDRKGEGNVLNNLGNANLLLHNIQRAIQYYECALDVTREVGDRRGEGDVLNNLGSFYAESGDAQRAISYYDHRLIIARQIGDRQGEGSTLGNLGSAFVLSGDMTRAADYYEQALTIGKEIEDIKGMAMTLLNMALLYARQKETERALPLAEQAVRIWTRIGHVQYTQRARQLVADLRREQL
jgi:serine/threonine protein kinase/Tfp pilus assembly protein PilF